MIGLQVIYCYHRPNRVLTGVVLNIIRKSGVPYYKVMFINGDVITRQAKSFKALKYCYE